SDQAAGKYLAEALVPALSAPLTARCLQCVESGIPISYDEERDDPAGRFTFHTMLIPVRDESGRIYRIVGIAHDITDLKRTEAELMFTEFSVDHSTEAIYWIGQDARILKVNEAACRLLGYAREEMLSLFIYDIDPNYPRERWPENWERSRKETSYTIETSHRRKDGSVFPVEVTVNFFEYRGKEYHFSYVRDITARKQVEEELRESGERFASAFENAAIGMALIAPQGHFLKVNRALCDLVGYSEDELFTKTFQDITYPEDLAPDLENVRRILAGEIHTYQMEKRYIHKQGHLVWVLLSVSLIRDELDHPQYFISQIQNITERKRIEKALRESEARYRAIVESQTEFVTRFLPDGTLTFVNKTCARFFGKTQQEMFGLIFYPFVYEEDRARVQETLGSLRPEQPEAVIEDRVIMPNGEIRWQQWSNRGIFDENGTLLEIQAVGRDITERKELERNNIRLRREYETFMQHELKNLFVPLQMHVDLLSATSMDGFSEEQLNYLRRIRESAGHALGVIDSLRRLQDIEAGRQALHLVRCSLRHIVRDVVRNLGPLADRSGVHLRYDAGRGRATVLADVNLLPGVFSNLVLNAIEHVADLENPEEKTVTVEMNREGDHLVVRIRNRGEPIPPERVAAFFDKFNVGPEKRHGIGLGTTYARLVTKAHGGTITVTSNDREGTTVIVLFPAARG
ncbi:MAG: PAS domain-containing protein, partial [Candidatus Latescibacterota bacterium]